MFMASDCTKYADRECRQCKEQCPPGQYMASPCNATHDAQCRSCSTLQQLNCSAKYPSFYVVPCSTMSDAACAPCSPECVAGATFEVRNCSGNQDRMCQSCRQCLSNSFESSPCTPKQDRKCSLCDSGACPPGSWESHPCKQPDPATGLMINQCSTCSFPEGCNPYREVNPTYQYTPCSGNATDVDATDRVCLPCTSECPQGQRMAMPCTWTRDAECVDTVENWQLEEELKAAEEQKKLQQACSALYAQSGGTASLPPVCGVPSPSSGECADFHLTHTQKYGKVQNSFWWLQVYTMGRQIGEDLSRLHNTISSSPRD